MSQPCQPELLIQIQCNLEKGLYEEILSILQQDNNKVCSICTHTFILHFILYTLYFLHIIAGS